MTDSMVPDERTSADHMRPTNIGSNRVGHTPEAMRLRIRNLRRGIRELQRAHRITRMALTLSGQDNGRLHAQLREATEIKQLREKRAEERAANAVKCDRTHIDGRGTQLLLMLMFAACFLAGVYFRGVFP